MVGVFPYSVRMRENIDQNNSEYGHFSRSVIFIIIHQKNIFNQWVRISDEYESCWVSFVKW